MSERSNQSPEPPVGPPPRDELDALLRSWHDVNAERAAAGRDRLVARLRAERQREKTKATTPGLGEALIAFALLLRSALVNRYSPVAASLLVAVVVIALLVPGPQGRLYAQDIVMVPDGGKLDAIDEEGNILGPCPLRHTDVDVSISGYLGRVRLTQTYHNPYEKKIEAVYTFPISHRGAVDRMTMTIGDRVVVGEVKERQLARQIYEAAREQGYVASLLEQERPNIFTQSVANIEPGAEVIVEISYVEVLQSTDGTYTFDFPMVVGPRYIPGAPTASPSIVPAELKPRHGLVLLGPAGLTPTAPGDVSTLGTLQTGKLNRLLTTAVPIAYPGNAWWGRGDVTGGAGQPALWYRFEAEYCDGSKEFGELYTDGTGQLNGRWLYADPASIEGMGTGFAEDTNQVPDASHITPEPVRPGERAGHDIGVTVTIDTGGPGIESLESELHEIVRTAEARRDDGLPRTVTLALADKDEIPNRDFVLSWRQTADIIQEATFTHTAGDLGEYSGGFFTMILQPPDRVADADVPPRELVFVMDTSGSMRGFPIEKSKEVMRRAIEAMRPDDTFNVITFAGQTAVLWDAPRPATANNQAAAKALVDSRRGGGGTEMMKAINAALVQKPLQPARYLSVEALANLPADGRAVTVHIDGVVDWPPPNVRSSWVGPAIRLSEGPPIQITGEAIGQLLRAHGVLEVTGRWVTRNQRRILEVEHWRPAGEQASGPMRIVLFLTDGYVGNDMAIIDAVRQNARTTRVFSFGIGNSVNRYLLEGMARAGRGEVEFVLLSSDADAAVDRFTKRVETPVLTDITLDFSDDLQVTDVLPPLEAIPDLFDVSPLVIHGRYTTAGSGTVTIRGRTGAGPYERRVDLELPESQPAHDVIATLWARAKVDDVLAPHLNAVQQGTAPEPVRREVIALGEQFQIMSQFTSFVAVEKSRLTIGGKPVLVAVPIEMPDGVSYEGIFGGDPADADDNELITLGAEFQTGVASRGDVQRGSIRTNVPSHEQQLRSLQAMGNLRSMEKRAAPGKSGGGFGMGGGPSLGRRRSGGGGPARAPLVTNGRTETQSATRQRGLTRLEDSKKTKRDAPVMQTPHVFGQPAAEPEAAESKATAYDDAFADVFLSSETRAPAADPLTPQEIESMSLSDAQEAWGRVAHSLRRGGVDGETRERLREDFRLIRDRIRTLQAPTEDQRASSKEEALDEIEAEAPKDDELRDEELEEAAAWVERRRVMKRVLHPALLVLVDIPHAEAGGKNLTVHNGRLLVTVLVRTVDEQMKQSLTRAGLSIEAAATTLPIIVGTVEPADLEKLALVEGVRRIEPTRMEGAGHLFSRSGDGK